MSNGPMRVRRNSVRYPPHFSASPRSRAIARIYVPRPQSIRIRSNGHCQDRISIASIRTLRGSSSTGLPLRASSYAGRPPILRALYAGGLCRMIPTIAAAACSISARLGRRWIAAKISGDSRSSVAVVAPSFAVASYRFGWPMSISHALVALPISKSKTPVANGSSVPACPIFVPRASNRFTRLTAAAELSPTGLSRLITPSIAISTGSCFFSNDSDIGSLGCRGFAVHCP